MEASKSGDGGDFDLFGEAVKPLRERRGRPSYAKSEENQRFVEVRAAAGWSHEAIAADMGIDPDTLRKHFSGELKNGALKLEGMLLDVLQQRAREGHIPSVRELQSRIVARAPKAPRAKEPGAGEAKAVEPKAAPVGKKQAALDAAQKVPDDWGDLMNRRQVRDN
ncbi:hypothetical protein GCM10010873_26700 [Cypionkella aquatica]|uniref:Uncharacterized protein n=1 Tax=Cypionkella aquatica TaxID=1756042 RepID=A0AA37X575_9RHOB|nr:hypothetical protein [Cypionkella aquatica]GLS87696.1 hypothetical protein GCM10010873_26700 [Cypionkella aquatica]